MADKILLVQGDTRPQLQFVMYDDSTEAQDRVDVTGATPRMRFRKQGSKVVLATLVGVVVDGEGGIVIFKWPAGTLDVAPGNYEGEVEITFADGGVQTMQDIVRFQLREQFDA